MAQAARTWLAGGIKPAVDRSSRWYKRERNTGNLTKKQVADLSKPGRYGDGHGLYLVIAPAGAKNRVQRVRVDRRRTDRGLGSVGKVSLP